MPPNQPPAPAVPQQKGYTLTVLAIILLLVLAAAAYYLYASGLWLNFTPTPTASSTPAADQSGTQGIDQELQGADVNASSTTDIDNLESQL